MSYSDSGSDFYLDRVLGAAIFDLSGLPRNYYISTANTDISWIQTIFQTLGLQALLKASLQLETFRHAVIHGFHAQAVIVRQQACYVALLIDLIEPVEQIEQANVLVSEDLIQWALNFDPAVLANNPHFNAG